LKHILHGPIHPTFVVAPRAGAWIETQLAWQTRKRISVAPRAGAWIET